MKTSEELWARYSALYTDSYPSVGLPKHTPTIDPDAQLALARLVSEEVERARAEEREACAKAVTDWSGEGSFMDPKPLLTRIAEAIRARSSQEVK